MRKSIYLCIDLKSFYASVECAERGLNPLTTNLVVADGSRTEKTICLAVSPSLKAEGVSGRPRLFEVIQQVKKVNAERLSKIKGKKFIGSSFNSVELRENPELELSYIAAPPRMAYYMKYSTNIYNIYLKYVSPEDIHVYSIDEVFMDITDYLSAWGMTAHEFARMIIDDVLKTTNITATAGIGTNLYLAKIAMDIVAKHIPADKDGVRIAELDEMSYRKKLWTHRPITDFWRVGKGYAERLAQYKIYTMGDIARCSLGKSDEFYNEELLYRIFGVNAELLIDHAWGFEPCTIKDIKAYKPGAKSLGSGQVLNCPYRFKKARLVIKEMADSLSLSLLDSGFLTNQVVLTVGYDVENLRDLDISISYKGEITTDQYGRKIPKSSHGTENIKEMTSSSQIITEAVLNLFDRIVNPDLLIRKLNLTACKIRKESDEKDDRQIKQLSFFTDYEAEEQKRIKEEEELLKERNIQETILKIKKKFGKNSILKGMNLLNGATAKDRNEKIGGHRA